MSKILVIGLNFFFFLGACNQLESSSPQFREFGISAFRINKANEIEKLGEDIRFLSLSRTELNDFSFISKQPNLELIILPQSITLSFEAQKSLLKELSLRSSEKTMLILYNPFSADFEKTDLANTVFIDVLSRCETIRQDAFNRGVINEEVLNELRRFKLFPMYQLGQDIAKLKGTGFCSEL